MNFFKIFFAAFVAVILAVIFCVVVLIAGVVGAVTAKLSSSQSVDSESVLVIDLNETIVDTPDVSLLSMIDFSTLSIQTRTTTLDAIRAIECASSDDNIKGIYIRPRTYGGQSLALLEELRSEIRRFKESGKFVVAYSDSYSQGGYYLASIADSLYLQPEGLVMWQGMAVSSMFYKGLLDKLDVDVEVFRPSSCSYKSAVEPFLRRNMSSESREQSEALVESIWGGVVADIAESRTLTTSLLNKSASALSSFVASGAVASGLIDRLMYEDELEQVFERYGVELNKKGRANRVSLNSYATNQKIVASTITPPSSKVAVVYAEGTIVDGTGEMGEIGGDALARVLREVREDEDIKSVVLRVNSPGGSALASDVIWREMTLLRKQKPVVVSMGGYAASGGYYISAAADAIVADKFTITGSIGVYGVLFDIEKS
ncbi:MAG: signal peptide peptidase SppA, partial [Rikenellaceae bacterium]